MKCDRVHELLWEFCEGSLDENTLRDVRGHLSSCIQCNDKQRQTLKAINALRIFETVEPRGDFAAKVWERIDAWETSRHVFWIAAIAAFVRRNRRVIVTSCIVFAVSLFGGLFALRQMTAPPPPIAEHGGTLNEYVIRDIPQPLAHTAALGKGRSDTVYTRFVARELTVPRGFPTDNYVLQPVVAPVSDSEPAF